MMREAVGVDNLPVRCGGMPEWEYGDVVMDVVRVAVEGNGWEVWVEGPC